MACSGRLDDRILGEIAGGKREAGERERADQHADVSHRQLVAQAAHFAHVLLVMHRVDHGARAKEQERLEEGMGEQMEHADRIGAHAHCDEHVAELRTGRVSDHALDVVLHEADSRGEECRGRADQRDESLRLRRKLEQRREPRHHEHAGRHHGGGMDQCRDRRWAFHRVRQPRVQQELSGLAHRAHEQQQANQGHRVGMPAEEVDSLAGECGRLREDRVEIDRAGHHEHGENAEREAEVADTVDDERLDRRRVRFRLVIPEADQEIAREPDALPAEEQLHEVVGRHQHQHREGEKGQIREEARPVRVLLHVADGIKVHEGRNGGDDHQHHGGQRIDADAPVDFQIAGIHPGEQHLARVLMAEADPIQSHP